MEAPPDLFALPHEPKSQECEPDGHSRDTLSIEIFERFLQARTPGISPEDRQLRVRMMHADSEGVAMRAAKCAVSERAPLFPEHRVAVTAHLPFYALL